MRLARNPLAKIRLAAGYVSAAAVAETVGCSRSYYYSIEQGRRNPSPELLERLALLFGRPDKSLKIAIRSARLELARREIERLT